jgi:hypothetical protein
VLSGKAFEATTMILSFVVFCASYGLIVWKDKSWINWATPAFFFSLGGHYLFQFAYLCLNYPAGSHYAYAFCYLTYALTALAGALVYTFIQPLRLKVGSVSTSAHETGFWPWVFLSIAFVLYLPILIPFRAYLAQPRHIYELTRNGYGVWFFCSTFFSNLALITFLFGHRRSRLTGILFVSVMILLTFWHGSKGLFLDCALIWVLYRVYVRRQVIGAGLAILLAGTLGGLVLGSFFLFSSPENIVELLTSVTSYADYVRNAMVVIDDAQGKRYYGRLLLGEAMYLRIPRVLMPDKPKDFGPFLLAEIYSPANSRAAAGTVAFDVGVQYADFGPFACLYLCILAAGTAWSVSIAVTYLKRSPTVGGFLIVLYLSGVNIFPVSAPFFLFDMLLIATVISLVMRFRLLRSSRALSLSALPNV